MEVDAGLMAFLEESQEPQAMPLRTPARQSSQPQPETPPVSKFYGSPPPMESTQTPASSAPASPATSQPPSGLRSLLSSRSLQRDNSQASLDSRATPTQDDINAMMRGVKEAQAEVAEAARHGKKKQNHQDDDDDDDGGAKPEKKADGDAKPKKNDTKVKKALGE